MGDRFGEGGEPIASIAWLRAFSRRYIAAWNAHDPGAVVACAAEDVIWDDPGLAQPARGRAELHAFVRMSTIAFPDYEFTAIGEPAVSEDRLVAYLPVRMIGTNTGPISPPGFAATGRPFSFDAVDAWTFRGGLIWRYHAMYDFAGLARQLGLMPPRTGLVEQGWIRLQRLGVRLGR